MTTDLSPKVAIVTGSTQGLGADIARGLAAQGARVVVLGRRAAEADAVLASLSSLGSDGLAIEADITDDAQIERAGQLTLGRVGDGAEVAAAVAFVCSDAASWITGCDIPVDGGYSMLGPDQGVSPRVWFERLAPAPAGSS